MKLKAEFGNYEYEDSKSGVLAAVKIVGVYCRFGETYYREKERVCFHETPKLILKIETVCSEKMLVSLFDTRRRHNENNTEMKN